MNFLMSKAGRMLLVSVGISLVLGLAYWFITNRAYNQGIAFCQAQQAAEVDKANKAQAKKEQEQRAAASSIAKEGSTAAARTTSKIDASTATTKEVIRNVYHEVPVLVAGQCSHALDPRVQARIDEAVDSANRP